MPRSTRQNDNMKIEHTTYDQSHGGRSTRRPSTSQTMTASRPRRYSERKALPTYERPVTLWPRAEASAPDAQAEMTTYLMLERRLGKEAREERTNPTSRSDEASYPRRKSAETRPETQPSRSNHPIRRKPNFSESLRECLGSPKSASKKQLEERYDMTKIYTLRDAIRAGKLEKVVPPPRGFKTEGRLAPPPLPPKPDSKPITPRASPHKKTSSAPSKATEFFHHGAGILDETRKDLAGKFMPPFEQLNPSTFTRPARKTRRNSDASDLSFCCIGKKETEPTKEVQASKERQRQNSERLSGQGTNPWSQPPPTQCRLCRKPGVRGIRGLCNECEAEFMQPKAQTYEFKDSSSDKDEVKPTPPLKDFKVLTARKTKDVGAKRKSLSHSSPEKQERRKPQGSAKTELKMTATDPYPLIANPPVRRNSQEGIIEGEDEERFRSWKTPAMRDEYERSTSLFKRWSDCYETDDFEHFRKNQFISGKDREETGPGTMQSRDSDFYGFYDDLLKGHGAKVPSSRRH